MGVGHACNSVWNKGNCIDGHIIHKEIPMEMEEKGPKNKINMKNRIISFSFFLF